MLQALDVGKKKTTENHLAEWRDVSLFEMPAKCRNNLIVTLST
jgi:hypothetical protein